MMVPHNGGDIVAHGVGGLIMAVSMADDDILVEDGTCQLQVTVGECTLGIGI